MTHARRQRATRQPGRRDHRGWCWWSRSAGWRMRSTRICNCRNASWKAGATAPTCPSRISEAKMKRHRSALIFCRACISRGTADLRTIAAQAQSKPSPSFTVFLKLCADPNMTPQTVRKAVESAGGTVSIPETKLGLFNSTASNWNATVQGQKFQISAIETYVPTGHNATQEVVGCNFIDDGGDDRAGQSAGLKQWVGVAPDSSGQIIMPGMEILTPPFSWNGIEAHTPVPDGDAARGDEGSRKSLAAHCRPHRKIHPGQARARSASHAETINLTTRCRPSRWRFRCRHAVPDGG